MSANQIATLKHQLRKQYQAYLAAAPGYGCGHSLSKHISADFSAACRDLNATLDDLAKIDPATPTTRF